MVDRHVFESSEVVVRSLAKLHTTVSLVTIEHIEFTLSIRYDHLSLERLVEGCSTPCTCFVHIAITS